MTTLAEWLEGEDELIRDRITELIHRRRGWALASLILKITVSGSVPVSGDFKLWLRIWSYPPDEALAVASPGVSLSGFSSSKIPVVGNSKTQWTGVRH
jgi:hypothetical protein